MSGIWSYTYIETSNTSRYLDVNTSGTFTNGTIVTFTNDIIETCTCFTGFIESRYWNFTKWCCYSLGLSLKYQNLVQPLILVVWLLLKSLLSVSIQVIFCHLACCARPFLASEVVATDLNQNIAVSKTDESMFRMELRHLLDDCVNTKLQAEWC